MPALYPSWIEIPAANLDRALAFYCAVFGLTDTPLFEEPPATIALLLPSDKSVGRPGVSLVVSPLHQPSAGGAIINFHVDSHADLQVALQQVEAYGGTVDQALVDMGDGVHFINVLDCEGNRIALSSYEPPSEG